MTDPREPAESPTELPVDLLADLDAGLLEPAEAAAAEVERLREERFLILPHPEVADYFRRKAGDYDRWLAGMRRLQASG